MDDQKLHPFMLLLGFDLRKITFEAKNPADCGSGIQARVWMHVWGYFIPICRRKKIAVQANVPRIFLNNVPLLSGLKRSAAVVGLRSSEMMFVNPAQESVHTAALLYGVYMSHFNVCAIHRNPPFPPEKVSNACFFPAQTCYSHLIYMFFHQLC